MDKGGGQLLKMRRDKRFDLKQSNSDVGRAAARWGCIRLISVETKTGG